LDYAQLIKNWHTKASDEDYFSKFVFEYLAFIAYLKTKKYPSPDSRRSVSDREAIQNFKREQGIKNSYLSRVHNSQELTTAWAELKDELDKSPLGNVTRNPDVAEEIVYWNCSHNHLEQKTLAEKARRCGVLNSLDDWENMVEFWHSIRNNLFHGGKDPEVDRDQLAVRIGYLTLSRLVDLLLEEPQS
jgi:hypothetical protein